MFAEQGDNITFNCYIISLSPPSIAWNTSTDVYIPKDSVTINGSHYISTITLLYVTVDYAGDYICSVKNKGGITTSTVSLTINGNYNYIL